jgi:hypothetical protein
MSRTAWIHAALALLWALTVIPTLLWWRDSVLWVAFMSIYAICIAHVSAMQGARAEKEAGS